MAVNGVSTPAVFAAGVGALVLWSAIKGVSVGSGFRALLGGKQPSGTNTEPAGGINISTPTSGAGSSNPAVGATVTGSIIANDALKYVGKGHVYKWGGGSPSGWDCSGFVNYVVGHDLGSAIPGSSSGSYSGHGPTTLQWGVFGQKISRSQVTAGDLVVWPFRHMGIAVSNSQMVNCPGPNGTAAPVIGNIDINLGVVTYRRIGLSSNSSTNPFPGGITGRP